MNTLNSHQLKNFWTKVDFGNGDDDCWNWTANLNDKGYGKFSLNGKAEYAHRISFFLEHGREPKANLLHSCDNPRCINPAHLHEGGQSENAKEAYARGRGKQKLSPQHVRAIRAWQGTQKELAEMFGVAESTISNVLTGRRWNWVK